MKTVPPQTWSIRSQRRSRLQDLLFEKVTLLFTLGVLAVLVALLIQLVAGAWPALAHFGPAFFISTQWDPVRNEFGALPAIFGTLVTALIALIVAVPLSFGIAVFLTELCPPFLRKPLGVAIELLAGIPSIIYGMWGLLVFAPVLSQYVQPLLSQTLGRLYVVGPLFRGPEIGVGLLPAGLVLAMMIIPFITAVMRDVFEVVPAVLKESAYGLGATTWEVIWRVVLPYTKVGVAGGIILGLGRALGETMAVTYMIGNTSQITHSLFESGNSIASTLANEFAEAAIGLHSASLMALGLVLFLITFTVLVAARLLLLYLVKREGRRF